MVTVTLGVGSGVNTFVMNYFRSLDHSKVHVDIVTYLESDCSENDTIKEIEAEGGRVFLLPSIRHIFKHISTIKDLLANGCYDVVHNNSLIITIPLMMMCKIGKIPVRILHSHATKMGETPVKEIRNKLLLPLLKFFCNSFAACSPEAGEAMFGKHEFVTIPNIIQESKFTFSQSVRCKYRDALYLNHKTVIATVGRICNQKNPIFALDVIKRLSKEMDNIVYLWVGTGPLLDITREYAKEIGISDILSFMGKRLDTASLYNAIDVFFLPSLYEGLPLTGVEAQAEGLPCVISDTVTKQVVYTDLVEFVSLDAPIEEWVSALEKQIARIPERRSYIPELRKSPFSEEKAGEYLTSLYGRLIEKAASQK